MGCGASSKKYETKSNGEDDKKEDAKPAAKEAPAATPAKAVERGAVVDGTKDEEEEEDEDDELEMDEEEFERMVQLTQNSRKSRTAVAAESSNTMSTDWTPPDFPKTPEQQARLRGALANSFMFASLEEGNLDQVIAAFKEIPTVAGTTVIKQGDEVQDVEPALYVIESGKLSVFKDGIEGSVFTYTKPGQYFGDLAVLYNAPRAATVVADEDASLWAIDRNTFNHLVKDASREAAERRMAFLNSVPIFNGLTAEEKTTISEALTPCKFAKDAQIIKEGEESSDFYIVESGQCQAKKGSEVVFTYEAQNFFGELALLKKQPRAADVFASEDSKLLKLGAETFKRMLGPLEDLLKEREAAYEVRDLAGKKVSAEST